MIPSLSLLALLTLATTPLGPEVDAKAAAVAPFVGEDVALVAHLDLARWQAGTSSRRFLGKLADDEDIVGIVSDVDARIEALKKAGATDLFLLVDPADLPGYPVAVVPLPASAEARKVAEVLAGEGAGPLFRWPNSEAIRGALVAGSPAALARVRTMEAGRRPEVAAALASAGESAVRIALVPSRAQRRAIEESFPTLPSEAGGGPIESVTRGVAWASIAMATEPGASLRIIARAGGPEEAKAPRKVAQDALDWAARASRLDPSLAGLSGAIARMKPEAVGESVLLDADLEKTAALVSVPLLQFRESARRSECTNNLKQIALAMHNYLSSNNNTFPAAYVASKDGKPLLSWRVMILPFLDQKELYDQFHLDEPWDGPHNKALIARMPGVFACPGGGKALARQGKTTYLTPRGPGTTFPGGVGVKIQDVTDGTSNTIMVVDAGDELAATWTRPDDWEVGPEFKSQGLFGHHPAGTNFGFVDGSVRFLRQTTSAKLLQALTTRNAGEVINPTDE